MSDIQTQLDEIRARLDVLEQKRWEGPPRLGPKPPTHEEVDARTREFIKEVKKAIDETSAPDSPPAMCTTSGEPVDKVRAEQTNETGQHKSYIVLCPDERAKGFVRPYRDSYKHVGRKVCGLYVGPDGATVCHMEPRHEGECGEVKGPRPQACNTVTTMGRALSETYARNPKFYGATFCVGCNKHLPVEEFVWTADGEVLGS